MTNNEQMPVPLWEELLAPSDGVRHIFAEDELHAMHKVGDQVGALEFGEVSLVSEGTGGHTETNLKSWEVA